MQICYQPRVLLALSHVGETDELRVQDASAFAAWGEELSYWELMVQPNVQPQDNIVIWLSRSTPILLFCSHSHSSLNTSR